MLVRPGASIPADGVVREGASDVNESMITGESRPVHKTTGEGHRRHGQRRGLAPRRGHRHRRAHRARRHHAAGRAGADVALAGAGARRPRGASGSPSSRSARAPSRSSPGSRCGARAGLRDRAARHGARHRLPARARARDPARDRDLDDARRAQRPAGARPPRPRGGAESQRRGLRQDRHAHARRAPRGRHRDRRRADRDEALRLAAAVERDSEHPIARAIVDERRGARARRSPRRRISGASRGAGCRRRVDGRQLLRRRPGPAAARSASTPAPALREAAEQAARPRPGRRSTCSKDGRVLAVFAVADAVRPESRGGRPRGCTTRGIEVVMMTGDARRRRRRRGARAWNRYRLRRGAARAEGREDRGAAGAGASAWRWSATA